MHNTVCACREVKLVIEVFSTVWSTNSDYIFHCFGESNDGRSFTKLSKAMMRKTVCVITELMKIGNKK